MLRFFLPTDVIVSRPCNRPARLANTEASGIKRAASELQMASGQRGNSLVSANGGPGPGISLTAEKIEC